MPTVQAVARSAVHAFSKSRTPTIEIISGIGVADDAHAGVIVQHLSRVARDPTQPNLRQVHLLHAELLHDLRAKGFTVNPGDVGENITTSGLPLLALPTGTRLSFPSGATLELTGLRNPCTQLNTFRPGLMAAVLDRAPDGTLIRKAGVMAIALTGGSISAGDHITVVLPPATHQALVPV